MTSRSESKRARATDPSARLRPGERGELSDEDHLLDLLSGKYRAQALSTVAALGIPDMLAERPRTAEELASTLGGESATLERLLRFTVGLGFLECGDTGAYSLTQRGEPLCSEALGRLAAFMGSPEQWDPWARLRDTLRSKGGKSPFEATFGDDLYGYLAGKPEAAARYDLAIDAFTQQEANALCESFDFSGVESLVDVGGGQGKLLLEILPRWPELTGVLVDRPDVVERAQARFPEELAGRLGVHGGDFFISLPQGSDCYCLKHVLHNWDDERATALLAGCTDAMRPGGRVLVIEAILTPDNRLDLARVMDFEMSVLTSGRARGKPDLRRMFRRAGLTLDSIQPVGSSWLLVGSRR